MTKLTDIIDTLDNAADSFENIATKEQKRLFDEVLTLAKDLETDTLGKVKQTIGNLKRLTQIKAKLAALAKDKDWAAGIAKFAQYFGTLQKMQNEYYSQHFPEATFSETAKKKNELMKQLAVQNTIEALMGDGLKANVTDKLNDILLRAVTTGAKYSDLQEELRAHLLGKDGGQGALVRYTTTYATTALSQYTGQHNKLLTDDLDTEWFMYTGSNKETTREFCEHLTAKKYIHRSEIPTILTGKIDDYQCAIYPKTGLPYGMIEGTTPENFQCNCGGWNCRHQLVPVADAVVPAHLRAKFAKPTTPAEPAKPQPTDLTPYQEQISAIERYIADHPKSAKIKGYLDKIKEAAQEANEEDLKAILKAAKADIAKFIAAAKAVAKKKANANNITATATPTSPLTPVVSLKKEYMTIADVRYTMREVDRKKSWFNPQNLSGGAGNLEIETNPNCNGSSNRGTGNIRLTQDRMNGVISAMDKITKGNAEDITIDEADAMATYWHEITHHRHHNTDSAGAAGSLSRRYMETANEYIARETMDEFYAAFGTPTPKNAIPFKKTRTSTSYNSDVRKLQSLIQLLQCDKAVMNMVLQNKLFNGKYSDMANGIANALYESGGKNLIYDAVGTNKQTALTLEDCVTIMLMVIEYGNTQKQILANYPNLRRKK